MKTLAALLLSVSACACAAALAQSPNRSSADLETEGDLVRLAQEQMGVTFQNLSIVDFRESPLPSLYQADIGGRIVYYSPDPELIFFGQIFDKSGVDLTAQALQETQAKKVATVDLDQALVIGPIGAPEFVEFSNPDCGYCRLLNNFVRSEEEQGRPVRRRIIFATFNEASLRKAEHILCAEDPEVAFQEIYGGAAPEKLNSCQTGREQAEAHAQMSRQVGIQGTPTVWLDGRPVEGFRQAEIMAFLQSKR